MLTRGARSEERERLRGWACPRVPLSEERVWSEGPLKVKCPTNESALLASSALLPLPLHWLSGSFIRRPIVSWSPPRPHLGSEPGAMHQCFQCQRRLAAPPAHTAKSEWKSA